MSSHMTSHSKGHPNDLNNVLPLPPNPKLPFFGGRMPTDHHARWLRHCPSRLEGCLPVAELPPAVINSRDNTMRRVSGVADRKLTVRCGQPGHRTTEICTVLEVPGHPGREVPGLSSSVDAGGHWWTRGETGGDHNAPRQRGLKTAVESDHGRATKS